MEIPDDIPDIPGTLVDDNDLQTESMLTDERSPSKLTNGSAPQETEYSKTSIERERTASNAEIDGLVALADGADGRNRDTARHAKFHHLKDKTKSKAKQLLFVDDTYERVDERARHSDTALEDLRSNPAFNPDKLMRKNRITVGGPIDKTLGTLQTVGAAIIHPKQSIKNKATRSTAGYVSRAQHPQLSQKADLEFLKAHSEQRKAAEETGGREPSKQNDGKEAVEALEDHRERIRVAWTTSRHVDRVRVVPKGQFKCPKISEFTEKDENGNIIRYDWSKWLGYMLLFYSQDFSAQYVDDVDLLPLDVESMKSSVERLIMASTPWQAWAMHIRQVYRWEDPMKTGKWLCIFIFLWSNQYIMAFVYGYIIYLVSWNYFYPTSVDALRESIERSINRGSVAFKFSEMVDKHGTNEWLGPLMDDLGPYLQLQLGDLANLLEILLNFYAWKSPKKTAGSLFFFFSCLLVCLFADMAYCMKIFWFIVGLAFFVCWPIASHYPRYRVLVSPFRWVLWGIPTNAEWAFHYLREQAQINREKLLEQKVEDGSIDGGATPITPVYIGDYSLDRYKKDESELEDGNGHQNGDDSDDEADSPVWHETSPSKLLEGDDIVSFRCQWSGNPGRLIVFPTGIRFMRHLVRKELWRRPFQELVEMKKPPTSSIAKLVSLGRLAFTFTDDTSITIDAVKDRDAAFNAIIAYSGMQWQTLQTAPGGMKIQDSNEGMPTV
ncbi:MAG: hypothetical protein M1819_002927 [Sarea resinae]|nr:MAG: hypothetical protein M1819_002927 [Sarea resinae]